MSELLRFKIAREEVPVEIEGPNGTEERYFIRELTGFQREKYLDKVRGRAKYDEKGQFVGLNTFIGAHTDLVAVSLYDSNDKLVNPETLKDWPQSTIAKIYEVAQKLSGLGEAKDEAKEGEEKND